MDVRHVLEPAPLQTNMGRRGEVGLEEEDEIHGVKDAAGRMKGKVQREDCSGPRKPITRYTFSRRETYAGGVPENREDGVTRRSMYLFVG
jgi:hypothetical protein